MKIYPNPSRSISYICIPDELRKGGNLIVRNQSGEIIVNKSFLESNSELLPIDLSKQPNGMYKVSLSDEDNEMSSDLLNLVSQN